MNNKELLLISLVLLAPALHGCIPAAVVAGGGAAVMVAEDRRSSGTIVDDQSIEGKVSSRISEKYSDKKYQTTVHIDVTSFNRIVLLDGEVPDQATKDDIGAIALGVEGVRNVQNEIVIGPVTSSGTHANDAYLTSKVKGRFVTENKFQPNHVKVVTENSTVFLMGLVKHKEGDDAAEIASTTSGVTRVVKLFEYID
jgi:osmotically-inducible protein OsmY